MLATRGRAYDQSCDPETDMHAIGLTFATVAILLAETAGARDALPALRVDGRRFVDAHGRHIILHGINMGFSGHPREGTYSWNHRPEDFARIAGLGFNCVRMPIFWSALEPAPGEYDVGFLEALDDKLDLALDAGLYVILDMHQDLWGQGVPGARGAPTWALLGKDLPHVSEGPVWSAAYFQSPRVQQAFDDFWANAPGPGGVGIQDRFAMAWKHVAARDAEHPAVIGYDLLNEPFPGSGIGEAMQAVTERMLPRLQAAGVDLGDVPENQLGFAAFDAARSSIGAYREYLAAGDEITARLDRTLLGPMYARVSAAIREVDTRRLLFTSPGFPANLGFRSDLPRLVAGGGGAESGHVLAPHAYDADLDRIRLIVGKLLDQSDAMDVPLLLGEWGNLSNSDSIYDGDPVPSAHAINRLLETRLASDTYWYLEGVIEEAAYFPAVQRPYPMAVAGTLQRYAFDPVTGEFECVWREHASVVAPTRMYVPRVHYPGGYDIHVDPAGAEIETRRLDRGDIVELLPDATAVERRVHITRR
jgi:endoglycosylceramidase